MLRLRCPFCESVRDEDEFVCLGEAFIARPADPDAVDDATWADYLFMRGNPKGWHWEQWQHVVACRRIFVVKRHTVSYAIEGSYTLAEGKARMLAERAS